MAAIRLRCLALCVIVFATSSLLESSADDDAAVEEGAAVNALSSVEAPAPVEAPADDEGNNGEETKRDAKRSGYCQVAGRIYREGEVFSYPGYSHCIKYRCENGGYSIVQSACERNSQCIPVGQVIRDGCRSLRCVREKRGNMNYYYMDPTVQDMCDARGRCVPKNRPFEHDCVTYECIATPHGGYDFHMIGSPKCKDYYGSCVNVGAQFIKVVNGRVYRNCICLHGGGYSCRG